MNSFSVGGVLSRSLSIWLKNFIPFTILSLIVNLPLLLYTYSVFHGDISLSSIGRYSAIVTPLALVLQLVASGAMTYGVFQQLRGQHVGLGQAIGVGFARFLPALGVGLLAGLCMLGGFLALVVPGFIVMCMLYVAVPAAIIERPGISGALKRSAELTRGYKWSIFGIVFLLGVINWVLGKVMGSVMEPDSLDDILPLMLASVALNAVVGTLGAVASAVTYHDLRVTKEGVASEELARIFD